MNIKPERIVLFILTLLVAACLIGLFHSMVEADKRGASQQEWMRLHTKVAEIQQQKIIQLEQKVEELEKRFK